MDSYGALCLPPFQCHWQGVAKTSGGRGNCVNDPTALAYPSMVPKGTSAFGRHAVPSSTGTISFTSGPGSHTSPVPQVETYSNAALRQSFENQGLSNEVAGFLLHSWRQGTQLQYGSHINTWVSFCVSREADPFQPSLNFLLEFLLHEFRKETGRSYSTMNTIRSAISSVASINDKPAGQHPLVKRFMKAVFQLRPALPRHHCTWDPELVLHHIRSLGSNENLSMIGLSRKLVMLMLLVSGQRGQALHLLDIRNMSITNSRVSFAIGDLMKTSRPGQHTSGLGFHAYPPDKLLCVYNAILSYLKRTEHSRGTVTRFFIITRPPFRVASLDTLRRWARDIMGAAEIDLSIFTPHSARSAASSKAALSLPLSNFLDTVGWSQESTLVKFYKKPLCRQGLFSEAVLS